MRNGNIPTVTEPNGVVTTYGYNKLNRLTVVAQRIVKVLIFMIMG